MQTAQINRGLHIKSSCALHRELFLNITIMSRNLLHLPHICKFPSRYSLAYSSGSSMASVFNAQSDPGLYSANIVLIVSYLLIVQSIICYKNQKHFNQFTMSLLFCVILFYRIFLPLYLPLSEFVNTGGTI